MPIQIRRRVLVAFIVLHAMANCGLAAVDPLYYASGTATPAGGFGGPRINSTVWQGVRFEAAEPITITAFGGLMVRNQVGNNSFFGAIVRLSDMNDFPDSINLSTPDVLTVKSFVKPLDTAEDMVVPIEPLPVPAGAYALIFGAGLLGTTGDGFMQMCSAPIGSPSFILRTGSWQNSTLGPMRFTVFAIPEPHAAWAIVAACAACARRRRA